MKITISHQKNPLMGWDVSINIDGESKKISAVRITVNSLPKVDESVSPPANGWSRDLQRVGDYPGDNKVVVTATDEAGNSTVQQSQW